jgi:hypothetical protein
MRISSTTIAPALVLIAMAPAAAAGKLEARYEIKLAGLTIGKAAILLEVNRDSYAAAGSASLTGVARMVASARGTAAVRGQISGAQIVPLTYSMTSESQKRPDTVRMAMAGGMVREVSAEPMPAPAPDRVPLTESHRKGVLDPLSAAMVIVGGTGDVLKPEVCARTQPIFDGRYRYEVELKFHKIENVSGAKGYAGPALVCDAIYRPIAGHRPVRVPTKYSNANEEIRVWLVPVAGTRALVPFRVTVGTVFGTLLLQASIFNSEVKEAASPPSPKSQ